MAFLAAARASSLRVSSFSRASFCAAPNASSTFFARTERSASCSERRLAMTLLLFLIKMAGDCPVGVLSILVHCDVANFDVCQNRGVAKKGSNPHSLPERMRARGRMIDGHQLPGNIFEMVRARMRIRRRLRLTL